MRVLFVAEQLNPQWASVPLVAYNLWNALSLHVDVQLVTHERNRQALEAVREGRNVEYVRERKLTSWYFRHAQKLSTINGKVRWPLYHALGYPVYAGFNHRVRKAFGHLVRKGRFDVVHAFTPVLPRYPVSLVRDCGNTPFILGPVNGGLPYPEAFAKVAKNESARLNVLRHATRLIPGYAETYRNADVILSGSTYTMGMLTQRFPGIDPRLRLFHENGVTDNFFSPAHSLSRTNNGPFRIVFVGRLVPYKGADMLLEAAAASHVADIEVTIVGDGQERGNLEALAHRLGLSSKVTFTGWIEQRETRDKYKAADVFVFPSVREFGGAVVLEAMAAGLPCVVVNHGGIGEYVTEHSGIAIPPLSRDHVVSETAWAITRLAKDEELRDRLSRGALARAREYRWKAKAAWLVKEYQRVLGNRPKEHSSSEEHNGHMRPEGGGP